MKAASPRSGKPDNLLAKASEAASFLRALAHEHRLAILCILEASPRSVGEIAAVLGIAQPKVSQHLMRLRADGLVAATRRGTSLHYRITSDPAREIAAVLKETFCPQPSSRRRA